MPHVNPVQVQKYLKGVDYPANKAALIENAKNLGADDNVCASLEQLPDEDFQTPADVSQAFGKMGDQVSTGDSSSDSSSQASSRSASQKSSQQSSQSSQSASGVNEFIAQAMQDSLAEVELCEMALQKTANDDIKVFCQRMIDDHSQMGREIEHLAEVQGIPLPKTLSDDGRSAIDKFSTLSGQDFDKQFIDHNVKDHEKDIKVFRHYAESVQDGQVKSLAQKGEKTLTHHLQMAKDIQKKLH